MLIRLTRGADGGAVLHCERADGTSTWQRQHSRQAEFFVRHDLTHYSVESVLECRKGFFGLVAEGWSIADTEGQGPRGALPPETIAIEHLVGFLDVERASGVLASAAEWLEHGAAAGVDLVGAVGRTFDDDALARVREVRRDLFGRWHALRPGDSLELQFPPSRAE